jgi:hypothetical protein
MYAARRHPNGFDFSMKVKRLAYTVATMTVRDQERIDIIGASGRSMRRKGFMSLCGSGCGDAAAMQLEKVKRQTACAPRIQSGRSFKKHQELGMLIF